MIEMMMPRPNTMLNQISKPMTREIQTVMKTPTNSRMMIQMTKLKPTVKTTRTATPRTMPMLTAKKKPMKIMMVMEKLNLLKMNTLAQ